VVVLRMATNARCKSNKSVGRGIGRLGMGEKASSAYGVRKSVRGVKVEKKGARLVTIVKRAKS